ncbi:Teichoic acid translocation permease protein TagG [Alienimonas californiensis]|uniref:Transport permease protein n=1 Tax=Alienimonas californiensis TaxID=2527989 RepID=A0A517P480_9PLAN|nr:Teichoic acid translocation permease protein TagG [Alienimonas californiensis]
MVGPAVREVRITPPRGWELLDLAEFWAYRDLFRFLVWRGIKAQYAQSAVGIGWAVIKPLATVATFTLVFGQLAEIDSGGVPYALFSFVAMVPWTYFSGCIRGGTASLVSNANMISKVYFPRLVIPLSQVCVGLVDFAIAFLLMIAALAVSGYAPNVGVLLVPVLVAVMVAAAAGLACWLTALAIQFRDVNHATVFLVQLGMYASPVIYRAELVPEEYRPLYAMNPMVGVIGGFRSAFLGEPTMPWTDIAIGSAVAAGLLLSGMLFFRRREAVFADVA